jgi:hypothetical protein
MMKSPAAAAGLCRMCLMFRADARRVEADTLPEILSP